MRAAIYARVSTLDQEPENQLAELRRYVAARGWDAVEFVDRGVSGAKDRRPALDQLVRDARLRRVDVLVVWRLDRLGRSLRHLILLLDELHALGVAFVSLAEAIDTSTPAGRLQLHLLGAIAQFERERIAVRIRAGMARARANGARFGRPERVVPEERLASVRGLSVRQAAKRLGVAPSTAHRWLSRKGWAKGGGVSPRCGLNSRVASGGWRSVWELVDGTLRRCRGLSWVAGEGPRRDRDGRGEMPGLPGTRGNRVGRCCVEDFWMHLIIIAVVIYVHVTWRW